MPAGKRQFHSFQTNNISISPANGMYENQRNEQTKPISRNPKNHTLVQRNFRVDFRRRRCETNIDFVSVLSAKGVYNPPEWRLRRDSCRPDCRKIRQQSDSTVVYKD